MTVIDLDRARHFFAQVFGWRYAKFPMPYDYYRIEAGGGHEPGIDGGIGAARDTPLSGGRPLTLVTVAGPISTAIFLSCGRVAAA